jgi:8-oxo-dGTP pyrophosphatase MutT (NUDIX family)
VPPHAYDVVSSEVVFTGRVISLRRDVVAMPGETTSQRDVVVHPGAVGVVALRGDEVLLVNQYRHPVTRQLDELPAGLLDVAGEPGLLAAQRELREEAGLAAGTWHVLLDILTSPGMTDESIRIYLARDVHEVERDVQEHEELLMTSQWEPLADVVDKALAGILENGPCVAGVLAASEAVRRGFAGLRSADAPWRARPAAAPED